MNRRLKSLRALALLGVAAAGSLAATAADGWASGRHIVPCSRQDVVKISANRLHSCAIVTLGLTPLSAPTPRKAGSGGGGEAHAQLAQSDHSGGNAPGAAPSTGSGNGGAAIEDPPLPPYGGGAPQAGPSLSGGSSQPAGDGNRGHSPGGSHGNNH